VQRSALLTAPLLVCLALTSCSSSTPAASSQAPASTSAAQQPAGATQSPTPSATAPVEPSTGNGGAGGSITFTGKLSGTMTISACPDGKTAQLDVDVDGADSTYTGIIDADDFTFVGPDQAAFTLAKGEAKPQVSGQTYTVKNTKLIGIVNDDTVTASGSVTCP
jgi:hypothetical protein